MFFNKTWNYVIILRDVFSITKKTYFYNEYYVHLVCEFVIVSNYDEMNCNLVFGVCYNVF